MAIFSRKLLLNACRFLLSLAAWVVLFGVFARCMQAKGELKMSNEKLITVLSVWFFAMVACGILIKILPDSVYKRICGWIFFIIAFGLPLVWCLKFPGIGRGGCGFWRHLHRGFIAGGTACAAALGKRKPSKPPKKKRSA